MVSGWRRSTPSVAAAVGIALLAGACASSARHAAPPAAAPPIAPARSTSWVDSTLAAMTPGERAGQLVWPMVFGDYAAASSPGWIRAHDWVARDGVGGLVMSVGSPLEIAAKLNALQALAPTPLLVGADLEFGAGYRARGGYFLPNAIDLGGATIFPPEMGIGASRDSSLAYEQGRITAIEGRALGVHVAFAPILDVNNNPANPVIGVRSYSENPRLAASLGASFVRGLQEHGMIATGKHFPGHGDTDQNSHLTLPTITVTRARMDSVELVPFRGAMAAGLGAIMTAHIALPAVIGDSATPATLSPRVMTTLLRRELGFEGLLITDAMDMNGVLASVRPGPGARAITGTYGTINSIGLAEACKRAIEAGADVLLMPSDVPTAIDAVVQGVAEGRFSQARVDSSVRRILAAKQRVGLDRRRFVDLDSARTIVGDSNNLAVARVAAERAITLPRDLAHLVPLARGNERVLSITLAPRSDLGAGVTFHAELRRIAPAVRLRTEYVNPDDAGASYSRLLAAADSVDDVIVGSYLAPSYSSSSAATAAPVVEFLRALAARHPRTVLVNFGNPYLFQQLPAMPTYVVAWGGFPFSQRAAALALFGATPITGRLPITIPPSLPFGAGEMRDSAAAIRP